MNTERYIERIPLAHSPGRVDVRSVTNGDPGMEVALTIRAGCATTDVYVTSSEAHAMADALHNAADAYDNGRMAA